MESYVIYNEGSEEPVVVFEDREAAFGFLKQRQDASFTLKPVPVFKSIDDMKQIKYYHASCNLGDSEVTVTEEVYFPEIEPSAPDSECTDVNQYGAKVSCSGTDIQKVALAIRKHVAQKRYEFEHAVRKVCNVVQPKMENGEAMTVNEIVEESQINQDTVVKILILLKKEGFLDIVDPAEEATKSNETKKLKPQHKLWTPQHNQISGAKGMYQISPGKQASIPIKKKKP